MSSPGWSATRSVPGSLPSVLVRGRVVDGLVDDDP
jgi:hypothetical protein